MMNLDLPQEDASLEVHPWKVTLGGLDPATISLAVNELLENAPVKVMLATFNPDTNLLIGVHNYARGFVSQVRIIPPTNEND